MDVRDKLKIQEDFNELRKKLEESLPDDKRHLAVDVTNLSLDFMTLVKSLENKIRKS